MSEGDSSPRELIMASSPSYSSKGDDRETVLGLPYARGPTEALGSRPVPTPAGMKNRVDLLLIQNILIPVCPEGE